MGIRGVVFDVGGVLEVTPPTGWRQRWCERLGIELEEMLAALGETWRAGTVGGVSLVQVERHTAEALGLDERDLRAFMADLWSEYLGTLNEELTAYFAALRPSYRTGILSNSFVGAREREQAAYGFEGLCDLVVYSHEVGMRKPDPRAYLLTCERLGVEPAEAVFLDDQEPNVDAARALGMSAVHFVDTTQATSAIDAILLRGPPPLGEPRL